MNRYIVYATPEVEKFLESLGSVVYHSKIINHLIGFESRYSLRVIKKKVNRQFKAEKGIFFTIHIEEVGSLCR